MFKESHEHLYEKLLLDGIAMRLGWYITFDL
jgi:hypothetical protein